MSVIDELIQNLPKDIVLTGDEITRPYESDGLTVFRQKPLAVILPTKISQIQQVLRICKNHNTPVVTRGAGTGLSGGATPLKDSVVLGMSKFNKIKSIDPKKKVAVVEPGVRNAAISEATKQYGLYYAPDPSSQIACTIGGNVAENSGGIHCLKYGLTVHNVESVKFLTYDGELLECSKNDKGLGLLALLNGSEGLLGIVTEVCVKLTPIPEEAKVVMASFDSVEECANAVVNIINAGVIPAGLEMMDKFAIDAAEAFAKVGYPLDSEALLLCEVDGNKNDVEEELSTVQNVLKNAKHMRVSNSESERLNLWKGRKSAFPAVGRLAPDYYCMDGTIPRRNLAQILINISELSKQYKLRVANVFHAGDGNLHPLILFDANKPDELKRTKAFGADILKMCFEMGGSVTGEHGVGLEKLDSVCHQYSHDELEVFHQIKSALDPVKILNPGKAIPELHRCAELGTMHVHNGKLPFPELERF